MLNLFEHFFFRIITWQSIVNDLVNKRGSLDMLPQLAQEKMTLPIVVFTHYYENSMAFIIRIYVT